MCKSDQLDWQFDMLLAIDVLVDLAASPRLPKSQRKAQVSKQKARELSNYFYEMEESTCFTCLDLASGFLQLKANETGRYLTAFRDSEKKLWEEYALRIWVKDRPVRLHKLCWRLSGTGETF